VKVIKSSLDGYMTRAQAARRLGYSESWVSRMMSTGKLACVRVGGRRFPSALGVEALATLWGRLDLDGGKEADGGQAER